MVKKVSIPDTNAVVEMYIVDGSGIGSGGDLMHPHWEHFVLNTATYNKISRHLLTDLVTWQS